MKKFTKYSCTLLCIFILLSAIGVSAASLSTIPAESTADVYARLLSEESSEQGERTAAEIKDGAAVIALPDGTSAEIIAPGIGDGSVVVTVLTPETSESSEAYKWAQSELGETAQSGFTLVDVAFFDETGNRIEPENGYSVAIDASALPEKYTVVYLTSDGQIIALHSELRDGKLVITVPAGLSGGSIVLLHSKKTPLSPPTGDKLNLFIPLCLAALCAVIGKRRARMRG